MGVGEGGCLGNKNATKPKMVFSLEVLAQSNAPPPEFWQKFDPPKRKFDEMIVLKSIGKITSLKLDFHWIFIGFLIVCICDEELLTKSHKLKTQIIQINLILCLLISLGKLFGLKASPTTALPSLLLADIILPANAYSNARLDFQKLKKGFLCKFTTIRCFALKISFRK